MKRRITRITVQTEREVNFTPENESRDAWCMQCARAVQWIDSSEATRLLLIDSAGALQDPDAIHLVEISKGHFVICLHSL